MVSKVIVVSYAREDRKAVVSWLFAAPRQRCKVHFMRNALSSVPKQQHQMVATVIRTAFVQQNRQESCRQCCDAADHLRAKFPRLGALLDEAEDDALAFMSFPKEHRSPITDANPLGRPLVFTNNDAIRRLIRALLVEQTYRGQASRHYMSQESLAKVIGPEPEPFKRIA
ncbi:MAG: transposase [Spirochaetales bacterium]|nr:transposase [Spirochaetales bacterium]